MTGDNDNPDGARHERDYRTLPPLVHLDDTITSVDPGPVPNLEAGRNVDQHRALRDE